MRTPGLAVLALLLQAQAPANIEPSLADAARFGAIATLAPLCNLRDNAWSGDLRQALIQSTTGADAYNESDLRAAHGQQRAIAALGAADLEATERLAEETPARACESLRANPDLTDADDRVRAWRLRKRLGKPVG